MKANIRNSNQAGFTLVELILGFVIIAVLTGVIFGVWSRLGSSSDSNSIQSDLATISQGVHGVYANQDAGYSALAMSELVGAKVFPANLKYNSDGTIDNSFWGKVSVAANANTSFFDISYTKVPSASCNKLMGAINKETFSAITIGGTLLYSDGSSDGTAKAWPSVATIQTSCTTGVVTMLFTTK